MMPVMAALLLDGYKINHPFQFPKGMQQLYNNFTCRGSRIPGVDRVVVWSLQAFFMKYLITEWNRTFFGEPRDRVLRQYKRRVDHYLPGHTMTFDHIGLLHEIGYLPIEIKALPEGTLCPLRVPMFTMRSTMDEVAWIVQTIETQMSCSIWHPMTSATTAWEFRKQLHADALRSAPELLDIVPYLAHDFSMRGQTSIETAIASAAAHLLSFIGSDTVPAVDYLEEYYIANCETEVIAESCAATEHAVMCLGGQEHELDTIKRIITEVAPTGIVSVVSDTWDFWNVIENYLPKLKDIIMARDGKYVTRPDSGTPIKILCGDADYAVGSVQYKGLIEAKFDLFGGYTTTTNCKQLDPHVGAIYGDSINQERAKDINEVLWQKGFASTNWVAGVGSWVYQLVTRDTYNSAFKATDGIVDGKHVAVCKTPKTDDGMKNSAKGLLRVNGDLTLSENVTEEEEKQGELITKFKDGKLTHYHSLKEVRGRLLANLTGG